jgi:hypothetical protein
MFGLIIAVIAYVGCRAGLPTQLPSQRVRLPRRIRLLPVLGIAPRQEPSSYG